MLKGLGEIIAFRSRLGHRSPFVVRALLPAARRAKGGREGLRRCRQGWLAGQAIVSGGGRPGGSDDRKAGAEPSGNI